MEYFRYFLRQILNFTETGGTNIPLHKWISNIPACASSKIIRFFALHLMHVRTRYLAGVDCAPSLPCSFPLSSRHFCPCTHHAFSSTPETRPLIKRFTSRLYTSLLYLALMLYPHFLALAFGQTRLSRRDMRLFTHRVLIALGLFRRKLPIRHVNSDVCVYSELIFSSSGQWPRNALMQIVAIAPRCGGLPRRDHYTPLQPSRAFSLHFSLSLCPSHPSFYPSISLLLYLSPPLALPKLIRPRESRGRRKSSRKFDCTRFATRALFYVQRYVSIGKSRGTETIVTNNAKIAFDAAFYDAVNWFALDRTVWPLSATNYIHFPLSEINNFWNLKRYL